MPLSKLKLKEIAVSIPTGVLSNGLSESGMREVNRLVDKLHGALFPKGQSVALAQVVERLRGAARQVELIGESVRMAEGQLCVGAEAIPLVTIKKMIRAHAGDVKVEDEVLRALCPILTVVVRNIMRVAAEEIKDGVAILDGKHVKAALSSNLRELSLLLAGVKAKDKSLSGKKRSSKKRSSKRCGRGKSLVKGFKRDDGVRVKAHCRKM